MGRVTDWLLGRDRDEMLERVGPIEGTSVSLWNPGGPIDQFWSAMTAPQPLYGTAELASRVWVANRCKQLNAAIWLTDAAGEDVFTITLADQLEVLGRGSLS